jgi:hypothetical protein
MKWPWRHEIEQAREQADQMERERDRASLRRQQAESADRRAEAVHAGLQNELLRNHFVDALRAAMGGPA